jgi:hypothetical protein
MAVDIRCGAGQCDTKGLTGIEESGAFLSGSCACELGRECAQFQCPDGFSDSTLMTWACLRSIEQPHRHGHLLAFEAELVDRDDVGVVERGDRFRLALEPLLQRLVGVEAGRDPLDGDVAVEDRVVAADTSPLAPWPRPNDWYLPMRSGVVIRGSPTRSESQSLSRRRSGGMMACATRFTTR